ncbi:MAG: hypothetical protein E7178_00175 [Erysipelotrichaceae bacterium]|nr:hypothetical protein [Erysipelotrichaceae bacterium]
MEDNKLVLTLIHRIELSPEYAEKTTGKKVGSMNEESLDIFRFQQDAAHKYGLKCTIQITYASLFNKAAIDEAIRYRKEYGDEIGLTLLGLPCPEFKAKYKTEDFCLWMFSDDKKKEIIDDVFGKFYECFGYYPVSTSCYFLDAFSINYIKEKYPSVKCAVAACWEEGPKAYHTCNNSWYTFLDGGPWNPWIPSKVNSHIPASSREDDCGLVAIPHLSRDLIACFDGNGSNFGTHPQNVLRGMIYYKDGDKIEYPYLYNLIDQYHHLGKYNNGFAYNMMYVGPGWLNQLGRWECNYELLAQSYLDGMKYYGKLKQEGKLLDLTMGEFADYYRGCHKDYMDSENALWKDILYGSNKQYFWYYDPFMRTCLDFNQGGAMIDLRNYAARLDQKVGIGTNNVYDASYPYLIQANYRAGYFTHYAGAGTVKSCKINYHGQSTDLCLCRTLAKFDKKDNGDVVITANPVTVVLDDTEIKVQSIFTFQKGKGVLEVERKLLNDVEGVEFVEYITAGFGVNEYQPDLVGATLSVDDQQLEYAYQGRKLAGKGVAVANCPQVSSRLEMRVEKGTVEAEEGIAFAPIYHLRARNVGGIKSWLKLAKAN